MKSEGMTLAKAIHAVKKQRFFIEPNPGRIFSKTIWIIKGFLK
jgi:hypothetical protein